MLNFNSPMLALGAIAACGLLTSIPALPASAEVVEQEVHVASLQAFDAPMYFTPPPAIRDRYLVSSYSLVQWPVPTTTTIGDYFGFRSCAGCSTDHKGIDLDAGNGFSDPGRRRRNRRGGW